MMVRIVPSYVAGLMLGLLGLGFCIGAFRLGFWVDDGPGPGLLPLVLGGLLMPMIIVGLRGWRLVCGGLLMPMIILGRGEPIPAHETSFKIQPLCAIALILAYAVV